MKTAFIFPGQGAQAVGMGKDFYDNFDAARKLFDEADDALGYSISRMCFEGSEDDLKLTANTQPAILVVSVIVSELLKAEGVTAQIGGGHSLGEYSALVAAGSLKFRDAVILVHKRGQFMQEAVPVGEGSMAAIIGLGGVGCRRSAGGQLQLPRTNGNRGTDGGRRSGGRQAQSGGREESRYPARQRALPQHAYGSCGEETRGGTGQG